MWGNRKYNYKYKHHYIYKITCLCGNLAGHYYIGKHSTRKEHPEFDGYYGGGVIIRKYYEKYPPELNKTITKEILEHNPTIEENSRREKEIIGDLWKTDPMCLNKKKGGDGGNGHANRGKKHTKEQVDQHTEYMKEYWKTHRTPRLGKGKMIECYDDDGELVGRFATQELAGKVLGGTPISWGLDKETNKQHGFRWRYTDGDSIFAPIKTIEPYVKPKKVMPHEAKEKMRAAKKGSEYPQKRVAVIATDKYGNDVVYDGIVSAAKAIHPENLKAAQKNIQQAAKGKRRVAYGYTWKYV